MALHQYIGARYVPKFYENSAGTSEWRSGVIYEPLTIVTWNGNSYTSKKVVPANIGDPSANPAYWVATGLFNQQIADLSNRVTLLEQETAGINAPPVNILTLGAKNDGSEDVSAIINQYSDNFSLYFPIGIYRLDNECIIRNNIIGAVSARGGDTVKFDVQHSGDAFKVDPIIGESEIVIRDILIEGNNTADKGISFIPAVRAFIDIDCVDILHCRGYAISIAPAAGSSRCARINDFIINGPDDLTNIAAADYNKIRGIYLSANVPDSEITNGQVMYCCIGINTMTGNTRISNTHIYCGQGAPGIDRAAWHGASEGIDASGSIIGTDIYVDTALQAWVQRAGNSEVSNFVYWDDGNHAASGRTDGIILSTRGTARIYVHGMITGGVPTSISQISGSGPDQVRIEDLTNEFNAAYYSDLTQPRKFGLVGYNAKNYTLHAKATGLVNNYYGEIARLSLLASGYAEIVIGSGSGLTRISVRRSGGTWTVTKLSEVFALPLYYKTDGNYLILFIQHSTSFDVTVTLAGIAGELAGLCEIGNCTNYPRAELADASTLTAIT